MTRKELLIQEAANYLGRLSATSANKKPPNPLAHLSDEEFAAAHAKVKRDNADRGAPDQMRVAGQYSAEADRRAALKAKKKM